MLVQYTEGCGHRQTSLNDLLGQLLLGRHDGRRCRGPSPSLNLERVLRVGGGRYQARRQQHTDCRRNQGRRFAGLEEVLLRRPAPPTDSAVWPVLCGHDS